MSLRETIVTLQEKFQNNSKFTFIFASKMKEIIKLMTPLPSGTCTIINAWHTAIFKSVSLNMLSTRKAHKCPYGC